MPSLKECYDVMRAPPADADGAWKRRRGYDFEKLLTDLLDQDRLEPRLSYKTSGEQIDGSFFFQGTIFLLEAKWHAEPMPASTLYQFKGKVDGKLAGTLGVFISMSGYGPDAVDALTLGKSLNLILFDQRDIDAAIDRQIGFREVLKRKWRKAAEEGVVFFPTEADLVTKETATQVEIESLGFDVATGRIFRQADPTGPSAGLVIVCEGNIDREIIGHLVRRILAQAQSKKSVKIVAAMGKASLPRVANAIRDEIGPTGKVLIVADADRDAQRTREMLEKGIAFEDWEAAIPDPEIEQWLGFQSDGPWRMHPRNRFDLSIKAADTVDIDALRAADPSFATFERVIREA